MKKYVILFVITSFCLSSFSQTRKERKAQKKAELEINFNETKSLLESKNFVFKANWAIPLGNDVALIGQNIPGGGAIFQGGRVDVSSNDNFIKLTDGEADVFMPYFGRVFFPKRNPQENGIEYKGSIDEYQVEINDKKKSFVVKFSANPSDDFLRFIVKISADGYASVSINSTNRQSITYNGYITPLERD